MTSPFCAFEHWPRRRRHALIWLLLSALYGASWCHECAPHPEPIVWIPVDTTAQADSTTRAAQIRMQAAASLQTH